VGGSMWLVGVSSSNCRYLQMF